MLNQEIIFPCTFFCVPLFVYKFEFNISYSFVKLCENWTALVKSLIQKKVEMDKFNYFYQIITQVICQNQCQWYTIEHTFSTCVLTRYFQRPIDNIYLSLYLNWYAPYNNTQWIEKKSCVKGDHTTTPMNAATNVVFIQSNPQNYI